MIAPAVIAAAVAFWAPYSPPEGACPAGVVVHENATEPVAFATPPGHVVMAWATLDAGDCQLWTTRWFERLREPRKCAYIAHEIGHSRFGLAHAATGIMRADSPPVPGICFSARKGAAHV